MNRGQGQVGDKMQGKRIGREERRQYAQRIRLMIITRHFLKRVAESSLRYRGNPSKATLFLCSAIAIT